jgi:parafibromin
LTSIKAKFLAKKREQITVSENDDELIQQSTTKEEDLTKEILNRERVWRNRTTILESNGKRFDTNIFAILQSIKTREEITTSAPATESMLINNPLSSDTNAMLSMQMSSQQSQPSQTQLSQSQQSLKTRALNYSRFDQERYGPKDDTGGFSIDTKRSYQYNGTISLADTAQTIMTQISANTPKQQQPIQQQQVQTKSIPAAVSSTTSSSKRSQQRPIIVVPASRTSIITLFNVVDILQDLK